jgi:RimJ/RimL family protein N-acetyltransferase
MRHWVEPGSRLADDRIELRLPIPSDADVLHWYASEDGGFEGVWVPLAHRASRVACKGLIDDWLAGWGNRPSRHGPALVIVETDHTDLIGQIGLGDRGSGTVELLYGIAPRHRGRGYAAAATRLVASWLLAAGAARQIELRIDKDHLVSQRVAVAAGFTLVGTVESHVPATGKTYEDLRFVMPATETHRQTLSLRDASRRSVMSDAALETVFDHFYARRQRDLEALSAGLDPDVVHQGVMPELVCNGRDEVLANVHSSFDRDDFGVERLELNAAGECVIVGIVGPRFREIPFLDGEIFIVFTVRDGLIVRMDDYRTREDAFSAVEASAPA